MNTRSSCNIQWHLFFSVSVFLSILLRDLIINQETLNCWNLFDCVGTAGADNYKCESQNCKLEYSASMDFFRWRLRNSIREVTAFMAQVVTWILFQLNLWSQLTGNRTSANILPKMSVYRSPQKKTKKKKKKKENRKKKFQNTQWNPVRIQAARKGICYFLLIFWGKRVYMKMQ